jgi:UrcA family protein
MITKSRLSLLAAAFLSTHALAAPARPAPWDLIETRTETVKYRVSEAATPEGAAALYARLQNAALRVCTDGHPGRADAISTNTCVLEALSSAVRHVAIPMVSALHQQPGRMPALVAR